MSASGRGSAWLGGDNLASVSSVALVERVLDWYAVQARDLPWRRSDAGPWAILVSEFMLQQTPVSRVLQPYTDWLRRWPTPADLAAAPAGDAVRAWGRLGYPRRALRLHAAARMITAKCGGETPRTAAELRALPGVGDYTAAAVATFAFGAREVVLDTNVRRVLARTLRGVAFPTPAPTVAEREAAATLVPAEDVRAARWAAASMELGALVCTARAPMCSACPVRDLCAWHRAGHPSWSGPARRGQPYSGTDRQCRGAVLSRLRASKEPVAEDELAAAWPDPQQFARAVASLVQDGLVQRTEAGPDGARTVLGLPA